LRQRRRHLGSNESLLLEPIQGGVQRANGDMTTGALFNLAPNPKSVGLIPEMGDGDQERELELSEAIVGFESPGH
jgi:hypothetical protein